jgi:Zn-dependent protease with chaperone function
VEGIGIYHDGLSAKERRCKLVLKDNVLHLYFEDVPEDFRIWSLEALDSVHLNGASVIIKYGDFPHQSLECTGEIAAQVYGNWSNGNVIRQAEGLSFSKASGMVLILVVAFISLCLLGWFLFLPWVAEKAASYVPVDVEVSLGESLAQAYSNEETKLDSVTFLLQAFVDKLQLDETYHLKVEVIRSEQLNAFALPGGRIFVYSTLLEKMGSYEELVAFLGHEVTHVEHRHSLKSICRSAAGSIVIATMFGDVTGISSGILSQADEFKQLDYSRDLETDADNNGLQLMFKNQVSGIGMLNLLRLLKKENSEMPAMMQYLSTHPDTDARIKNIEGKDQVRRQFPKNAALESIFKKIQKDLSNS